MLRQFAARQPYLNLKEALGTPIGKKHEMSRRDWSNKPQRRKVTDPDWEKMGRRERDIMQITARLLSRF